MDYPKVGHNARGDGFFLEIDCSNLEVGYIGTPGHSLLIRDFKGPLTHVVLKFAPGSEWPGLIAKAISTGERAHPAKYTPE